MLILILILMCPFFVVIWKAYLEACIYRRLFEPWRSKHFDGDINDWKALMKRRDSDGFRAGKTMLQTKAHQNWFRKNLWFMGGLQWYSPFWFIKTDYLNMARLANGMLDLMLFSLAIIVGYIYVRVIDLSSPWSFTFLLYLLMPAVKSLAYKFWCYSWLDKNGLSFDLWFRAFVLRKAKFVDGDKLVVYG